MGNNLGINKVHIHWFGWGGLQWHALLPFFFQSLRGRDAPDVLLIHCGGNDLGETSSVNLVLAMKEDLQQLHLRFSLMKIIFDTLTLPGYLCVMESISLLRGIIYF